MYAYLRRANQNTDPTFRVNTTAYFQTDQIQNALNLLGTKLGTGPLRLGIVFPEQLGIRSGTFTAQLVQRVEPEIIV